jgi:PUA-domain protein
MPKKYRRHFLKAKEVKSVVNEASEKLKVDFNQIFRSKVKMELVETDFAEIFLINGKPLLFRIEGKILPTLIFNELSASVCRVVVDMGAVPYVCNGASVMAPGIVRFEGGFKKGDLAFVVDEKHGKAIAVGEAVYDVDTAKKVTKGVVMENIHFVGDKIWNFIKKLNNIQQKLN